MGQMQRRRSNGAEKVAPGWIESVKGVELPHRLLKIFINLVQKPCC